MVVPALVPGCSVGHETLLQVLGAVEFLGNFYDDIVSFSQSGGYMQGGG